MTNPTRAEAIEASPGNGLNYQPGALVEVFERGQWAPCVIISIAGYIGKAGPGYYASYDPARTSCGSFWCNDHALRRRA